VPNDDGIDPVRQLRCKSRTFKAVSLLRKDGIVPYSELFVNLSEVSAVSFVTDEGIVA
jgi:hypothetical protein